MYQRARFRMQIMEVPTVLVDLLSERWSNTQNDAGQNILVT